MPATNGMLTPPKIPSLQQTSSSAKRKRSDDDRAQSIVHSELSSSAKLADIATTLDDVFAIISSHDAAPAILNYPLSESHVARDSVKSPPAKKAKVEQDNEPATISRKIAEATYASLQELQQDVAGICSAQIASLKEADEGEEHVPKRLSVVDVVQIQDIMAFELFVRDLIARESGSFRDHPAVNGEESPSRTKKLRTEHVPETTHVRPGRSVLSLYGNAPNPRQLFSSLQEDAELDMSLEDLGLPSSLTASQLLPLPTDTGTTLSNMSRSTFRDTFPAPPSVPQLQPPAKLSRQNRGGSITFVPMTKKLAKLNRKGTYTVQPLYAGSWLRYGTREKKSHDKSNEVPASTELEQQERDLFASAYSSFAPTHDDSRAIFSAQTRAMVWWQRAGNRRINNIFESSIAGIESASSVPDPEDRPLFEGVEEAKVFEEAVNAFDETTSTTPNAAPLVEVQAKELLLEINDLLTTLASYQYIRNAELTIGTRNPSSPAPSRLSVVGTPKEPSDDEVAAYRTTKERLAFLIDKIPPHVVAKFNGEQLDDLRVSRNVLVETDSVYGVLEEDQQTRAAKGAASAAATTNAPASGRSSSIQTYGQSGRLSGLGSRPVLTPQTYQQGSAAAALSQKRGLPPNTTSRRTYSDRTPSSAYGTAANPQYNQRQGYPQQLAGQGSPQPPSRSSQYGSSQSNLYQRSQLSNTTSYNHNANTFGVQRSYVPSAHGPDGSAAQQWANTNGRMPPAAATASATAAYASPSRTAAQFSPKTATATPQAPPAQMVPQTNGISSR